ncbi:guanylate cyclase domain-containing protein, partial [Haematococcus lacustris]
MLPRLNLSDPEWERSSAPAQTSMSTRPLAGLEPNCWHEIEVKPVVDPVTKERALLLVQRDVSERARLERNLAELTEAQLSMLSQIFPRHVIEALSMGAEIDVDTIASLARSHHDVSILFMDIAGFTAMSKDVPAEEVIIFLNILFSRFDMLVESHGVQKIGDAYLVASGILVQDHQGFKSVNEDPDPEANARRLVAFAFDMMQSALAVRMPNGQLVRLRIGIHTGPCVSGLVGMGVPKWSVFGDTVNTAARLEQTCELCMIQVSEYTYSLLGGCFDGFKPSGGVHMKGKGLVQTHLWAPPEAWLQAAEGDQVLGCAAQGSVVAMQPVPPTRGLWQQAQSSARPLTILEDSEDGVSQASNSFSGVRAQATAAAFDAFTAQPPVCTSSAKLPSFQLPASSHSTRLAVLPGVLQPFSDTAWQSLRQRRASDVAGRGLANQAFMGSNNEAKARSARRSEVERALMQGQQRLAAPATAQGFTLNYTNLPLAFNNMHLGQGFPATLPSPMPAVSTRGSMRSSRLETGSSDPLFIGQGFTLGSSNGWSSGRQQHSPAPRPNIPLKQVSTCQSDASVESTHKQVHQMWHLCLTAGRQRLKANMQSPSKGPVQSQKLERSKTWMLQAAPAASITECEPTPSSPAAATSGTGMGVHSLGRRTHVMNPYQGQAMLDLPVRSPRVGRSGTGRSLATSLTQASFLQPSITRLATPWLLNADPAAQPSAQHCLQPPELSSSMPA